MQKTITVVSVACVLIMAFVFISTSAALDRHETGELLQKIPHLLRSAQPSGNLPAVLDMLQEPGQADMSTTYRLARESTSDLGTSDTCYMWDGGQWVRHHLTTRVFGGNQLPVTETELDWDGGAWVNVSRQTYTYDGNNRIATSTAQDWVTNQWENAYDYAFTYDGSGYLIEMLGREWDEGEWVNAFHTTSTYSGGKVQTTTTQFWIGTEWMDASRSTYTYSGSDLPTEIVSQLWLGSSWVNQSKTTITYNGHGSITEEIYQSWAVSVWLNSAKYDYTYDGSDNEILRVSWYWQVGAWSATDADTSKYSSGKLIEEVYNDIASGGVRRTQYTYSGDNVIADLDQVKSGSVWVNEGRCVYVYTSASGILTDAEQQPSAYSLGQNYPNPFNASTVIRYSLDRGSPVTISVYNLLGQTVIVLEEGFRDAGVHETAWDGADRSGRVVPSGVYFYRLAAGEFNETRKMVLLK